MSDHDVSMESTTFNSMRGFTGEEIEDVCFLPSERNPRRIEIRLKDGRFLKMYPELDVSRYNIQPKIKVEEGKWGELG